MRVILMLGSRSQANADKLKEQRDSIDIEAYGTVKEMMDNITQRHISFDRIVISTASLNDETTMQVLHRFLREMHPRATVVYIYQRNKGERLASLFNNIFNSPLYTDMVIGTNSISLLEESATASIDTLRDKYSIRKYGESNDDVLEDSYSMGDGVVDKAELLTQQPMLVLPQSKKQKKRTNLRGLKKLTKQEMMILQLNMKLVGDYMRYLQEVENGLLEEEKYERPQRERPSMSDPIEDYKTELGKSGDINEEVKNKIENLDNLTPDPTFTQLELGYYGFSVNFDGRPMMFRVGVRVTQERTA